MQRGLTLVELAQKITANQELKRDYIADTESLTMQIPPHEGEVFSIPELEVPDQGRFPILSLAHDQIASRTNIPGRYYKRMLAETPDLLAMNVNTWFRRTPEKRMIRTLGGDIRAFLSNRYQRIENEEIAEVALPALYDIPDVKIVSSEVTDRRLYIQAVSPRVEGEVRVNDIVQAGVVISNSEVGLGSVSVQPMLYRLVCLNGMVVGGGYRKYHIGRRVDDNEDLWADDTKRADDDAVLLKVRDMVRAAVDQTHFDKRVEQMVGLTQAKVTGSPDKVVEVLASKVGATESERGGILRALIEGGDLSAWGLLNAVTAQAHEAPNYDRGVEFEVAGGQLLELPKSEWQEMLEAA